MGSTVFFIKTAHHPERMVRRNPVLPQTPDCQGERQPQRFGSRILQIQMAFAPRTKIFREIRELNRRIVMVGSNVIWPGL